MDVFVKLQSSVGGGGVVESVVGVGGVVYMG
jgi:hypothetical protein